MGRVQRSFLAPEVIQASLMDCGPAALHSVLQGFGVTASYDDLRARCETDVDGTSIDGVAALGREFGLSTHEILVPADRLLLHESSCLPAIALTTTTGGALHFVVVWRTLGSYVQLMDPMGGRRWVAKRRFLPNVAEVSCPASRKRWKRWSTTPDSLRPLHAQMLTLGLSKTQVASLVHRATADGSGRSLARLDAAVRMVAALVDSGVQRRGRRAARLLETSLSTESSRAESPLVIPQRFFWVDEPEPDSDTVMTHGTLIVHFSGTQRVASPRSRSRSPAVSATRAQLDPESLTWLRQDRRHAVAQELTQPKLRPLRLLWAIQRSSYGALVGGVLVALAVGALLVPLEGVLLRSLLSVDRELRLGYQRVAGISSVVALIALGACLDGWTNMAVHRMGRELETRVRVGFLDKLPRLEDEYLRSRPSADMVGRGNGLHMLRQVSAIWTDIARNVLMLLATTLALLWLFPEGAFPIVALALVSLVVPHFGRSTLAEVNVRLHAHNATLGSFYLDALVGTTAISDHGAERAVRSEHEERLKEWAATARSAFRRSVGVESFQDLSGNAAAAAVVVYFITRHDDTARLLLVAFWALQIPQSGRNLALAQLGLQSLRGLALRMVSPLSATTAMDAPKQVPPGRSQATTTGIHLLLHRVVVRIGGHDILRDVDLSIPAGSHVGIVGASGAGKSSLLGLFLGWSKPFHGSAQVDGQPLNHEQLAKLREQTAWIDPSIRLWDASLYDNLVYGDDQEPHVSIPEALSCVDLVQTMESLPNGMQSKLGEGGVRVSGGQGQLVRVARALLRRRARLVILDEPFRGLEAVRRLELLGRIRKHWQHATLLFASHDVRDTESLDRVIVIEQGRIVEDGSPVRLASDPASRYSKLLAQASSAQEQIWSAPWWRRLRIANQRLTES